MADQPNSQMPTMVEHRGWQIASTTPPEQLRQELESADAQGDTGKPGAKEPPSPSDASDKSGKPGDPQPPAKPGAEAAPAKPAAPDPKTPEGRKAQLQSEINALVREKHEHKNQTEAQKAAVAAELQAAREELERVKREIAAAKPGDKGGEPGEKGGKTGEKPAAGAKDRAPEPSEDDFEDFRDYVKAHGQWVREQAKLDAEEVAAAAAAEKSQERDARREQEELEARQKSLADAHRKRIETYQAEHPEFAEIMAQSGDLPTNPAIDAHILHSDNGPALMQYFAENPEECERIAALGWGPTLVEIGKIEAMHLSPSAKSGSAGRQKPVSKAKPPVSPVGGAGKVDDAGDEPDLSTMEFSPEYVRLMNEREDRRSRQRRV